MAIRDLEYQRNQLFLSPQPHLLGEMAPSGRPRHDSAYERFANHATPLKHNYASTSKQPTTMPSALPRTHHRTKKVHFASNVVDNERKPQRTISPLPRPESPPHSSAMSSLALKVSKGASRRVSTSPANTLRPMNPGPSRSTALHRQPGPANTSAKRHSSTSVSVKGSHGTSKKTHLRGGGAPYIPRSSQTPDYHSLKTMIGPVDYLSPVPEPPIRQGPPPTPRPARLSTPDLDDISYRNFCACDDSACRRHKYPHEFSRRSLSKMEAQMQAAQTYMKSFRT